MAVVLFCVLICFLLSGVMVGAAPVPDEFGIDSTTYFYYGTSGLYNVGNGTVTIDGLTRATQPVDRVWVKTYLQRYENGTWKTITSGATDNDYNTDRVRKTETITIQRGYSYRTMSEHQVFHNGVADPATPYKSYSGSQFIQ